MPKKRKKTDAERPLVLPGKRRKKFAALSLVARAAIDRTRAARAERDAFIADVDMSEYDHLPVIEFPKGRAPVAELPPDIVIPPPRPPMAPPVPFDAAEDRKLARRDREPAHREAPDDERMTILLDVITIDRLETLRIQRGELTLDDVVIAVCLGQNIPAPAEPVTPVPATESVVVSTIVEPTEPEIIPAPTPDVAPAKRTSGQPFIALRVPAELIAAFDVIAAERYPAAEHPANEMLRAYMAKEVAAADAETIGRAVPRPTRTRGRYTCSKCHEQGHRADNLKIHPPEQASAAA